MKRANTKTVLALGRLSMQKKVNVKEKVTYKLSFLAKRMFDHLSRQALHKKVSHKLGLLLYGTPPTRVMLLLLLLFSFVCVCVPDCLKRYSFPQGSHCFGRALQTFLNSFPRPVCHIMSLVLTHLCI